VLVVEEYAPELPPVAIVIESSARLSAAANGSNATPRLRGSGWIRLVSASAGAGLVRQLVIAG